MPIKFRAVDTGKLGFPVNCHAARAAHPDAVHHKRVQADGRGHAEGQRRARYGLHHRHRTHGNDFLNLLVFFKAVLQQIGHKPLVPIASVIRRNEHFVTEGFQFVLKQEQILAARADDGDHVVAGLVVALGDMVHRGDARAATDTDHAVALDDMRGFPERAGDVKNAVAFGKRFQHHRRFAHHQIDDGDRSLFRIRISDGQREALPLLVDAQHDKVPRFRRGGNLRRIQHQFTRSTRNQRFLMQDRGWHV